MLKYLRLEELQFLIDEIKSRFVQKVSGKDLSSNDYTNLEKDKLDKIESNAQINKIELIKRNGINVSVAGDKSVDILIPTKLSDLTNDKTFQTKAEIQTLISTEGRLKKLVVTNLPDVGIADDNTLYLVPNESGAGHIEWLLINGKWEMIGDTGDIDLSGYLKVADMIPITEQEILTRFNA